MSKPSLKRDPLSATARDVLTLFSDALHEVRFPDVDLQSLQAAADELRALQLEVERIEAELEEARAQVAARIYAESDPKLAQRVAEIGQGKVPSSAAVMPKKRGRARKSDGDSNLFGSVRDEELVTEGSLSTSEEHAA
jgi:hypothetical protein